MSDEDDLPTDEPTDDEQPVVSERQAVERKSRRIQRERTENDQFWRECLSTQVGRRCLWAILEAGHCFEERFMASPVGFTDPNATWFKAGEQAFAWKLFEVWQTIDYQGVYLMRCENDSKYRKAQLPAAKR